MGITLFLCQMTREEKFMAEAIKLSELAVEKGEGGPFGCVIVKEDKIIGRGYNRVLATNDPTAHAEVVAIRDACKNLSSFQLEGCEVYTSCEPCPMCLGALYWARPKIIYYANTREDASENGFDDSLIYDEISKSIDERKIPFRILKLANAYDAFENWENKIDRTNY